MQQSAPGLGSPAATLGTCLARLGILLLPVSLMTIACLRSSGDQQVLLGLGAVFQGLAFIMALSAGDTLRRPIAPAVVMLYVIGLSWMLLGRVNAGDWFLHISQAVLLVVPIGYFSMQCLSESGALALRKARQLTSQLARRREWPADLQEVKLLPEVKALRDSLHFNASPALALLGDPRPEVRVAALAALEFRASWQRGQPEMILEVTRQATEPEVRAAAVNALANTDDRTVIEALGDFMADPAPLVRQATTVALLWNTENRWPWIRLAVRYALAHPVCRDDGPLNLQGKLLAPEAVADLTAWAAEKGILSCRAALTLSEHYGLALASGTDENLIQKLRDQLAELRTPAMLRLELARLLYQHRELDPTVLKMMLDPSSPAPLRLIAVEALLAKGDSVEATSTLRDLARLPNREIALATAEVVQRRLGVDLGLPRNLPALHTKPAADAVRRVLQWANQSDAVEEPAPGRPAEAGWRSYHDL